MASVRRSSVVGGRSAQRAGSGSGSDSIKIGQTAAVRLLSGYEVMQQLAAAQLAVRKPDRAEMLVVGAGTGAELTALAPGHPGWRFTPVDPAASMLAVARGGRTPAATPIGWSSRPATLAELLRPGAPMAFAGLAIAAVPESRAERVRRLVAMALGWSASEADAMVTYMSDQLHPVEGAALDRLLAETGFGSAEPFFRALGYRAWITQRVDAVIADAVVEPAEAAYGG